MLAIKLFDDEPVALTDTLLSNVSGLPIPVGIELACYSNRGFTPEQTATLMQLAANTKILHSHRQVGFYELATGQNTARRQLKKDSIWGDALGTNRLIIHGGTHATKLHQQYESAERAAQAMVTAVSVCMELGIVPYFENTYEPLNWLIPFFDELIALGIAPAMGFCMDIGHVNVWGRATLDAFYVLAKNLRTAGFAQHFHIHANDGHADAHIALHTAYTEGLLAASAKWAPAGVLPWLATAMAEYPTTLFTLENKQAESDEALAFTLLATE